tara:strand:- start:49 stop:720 length:672 start_codon:yes stop_codon:yes gene_type:complete
MKLKQKVKLLITCDSGAAAGKTTAAKFLSKKFGLNLLTSGLLYRYVAYKLLDSKKNPTDVTFLKKIINKINSKLLKNKKLYSPIVTVYTSEIAKIKKIRKMLNKYQRKFATKRLAILEGRDMGILFPDADIKIFFKCSLKVAAKRRFKELKKTNKKVTYRTVERAIKLRNQVDSTRKISPLRIPDGAVIVDTTNISKKQMFDRLLKIVEKELFLKYGRNYKTK